MPDPAITGFVPTWFRDQPFDTADALPVAFGTVPDQDPRVVTRLVPKDHGDSLAPRTLSRVFNLKQDLAIHAARDVVQGYNPNFIDLTSVPPAIRKAATLAIEPSTPGSYVIPARLPARGQFDVDAVINRYAELLSAVDDARAAESASIGALQVCRALGSILGGEVESMEVTTYDKENSPRRPCRLTAASVERLDRVLTSRRATSREFEKLTGRLEALDIGKNEFQLKIDGRRRRVKGSAAFFSLSTIRERLGEIVTLEGEVVSDAKSITMTAYRVVDVDAE